MCSNFFNNKIFLFLIILIIGFICIGSSFAVNADNYGNVDRNCNVHLNSVCDNDVIVSDVGGNVENIKNSTIQTQTISNKNDNSIGNSVDLKEIKCKSINNFSSSKINPPLLHIYDENNLQNALNSGSSLIYLCADISLTKPINVTNDVVIDGNGHTIKFTKPFTVGSAFQWYASKGIITNCIFENTSATCFGGAIYISQGNCGIINCSFNNCHARYKGGAIYSRWGNCSVVNCSFNNCYVDKFNLNFDYVCGSGGAIYINQGNCSVVNCVFRGCHAICYGGAVYDWFGKCYVVNCSFETHFSTIPIWGLEKAGIRASC